MERDRDNGFKGKVLYINFIPEPTQRAGRSDISLIFKALDGLGQNTLVLRPRPFPGRNKAFVGDSRDITWRKSILWEMAGRNGDTRGEQPLNIFFAGRAQSGNLLALNV